MGGLMPEEIRIQNFSLEQICRSGQCFRMRDLGEGCFSLTAGDKFLRAVQNGDRVTFYCSPKEFSGFWEDYFDLGSDYGEWISGIDPGDPYLTRAAREACGVRILRQDLWEMLVTFLISQRNNIPRITRSIELLCKTYGEQCQSDDGTLYYSFPPPEALAGLPEEELKKCNLGYRSKYVVRTARQAVSGQINLKAVKQMPYKEAREELLKCFGVGEKVADCVCLFGLHHLEAFPVDTHIRQALESHYPEGFPKERYRECLGVMQQYIFYHELHGKDI